MNRWLWGAAIFGSYAASFALPAYLDLNGLESFVSAAQAGLDACSEGEVRQELLGWLPNPLLWLGGAFLMAGHGRLAAGLGLTGGLAACSWLVLPDLQAGYFLWLGSMALLAAGGVAVGGAEVEEIV